MAPIFFMYATFVMLLSIGITIVYTNVMCK